MTLEAQGPQHEVIRRIYASDKFPKEAFHPDVSEEEFLEVYCKKYDPEYYEYEKSLTDEDRKVLEELSKYWESFTLEDYIRFLQEEYLSEREKEQLEMLERRDFWFKHSLNYYRRIYDVVHGDIAKFRKEVEFREIEYRWYRDRAMRAIDEKTDED